MDIINKKTVRFVSSMIFIALFIPSVNLFGYYQQSLPGSDPNHSTDTYNELLRKAGNSSRSPQNYQTPNNFQQGNYNQQGANYQQGNYYQRNVGTFQQRYYAPGTLPNYNTNPGAVRQQNFQNQMYGNPNLNNPNPNFNNYQGQ